MSKDEKPAKRLTLGERLRKHLRNRSSERKKRLDDQREANEKYSKCLEQNKNKPPKSTETENTDVQEENLDQSVYEPDNPEATQEDDMEEDLALLDEDDDLW